MSRRENIHYDPSSYRSWSEVAREWNEREPGAKITTAVAKHTGLQAIKKIQQSPLMLLYLERADRKQA